MTDLEDCVEGLTFGKSSWSFLDLKAARQRHQGHYCPDNEDNDNDDSKLESSNNSQNHSNKANTAFIRAKQ